jgi:TRAP-type uncharacterized transport system fused permease subunit
MPAFVVPFFFVLDPLGAGVLLKLPAGATWFQVSWIIFMCFFAIAALAAGLQGWAFGKTNWLERSMLVVGGLLVIAPSDTFDMIGVGIAVTAIVLQVIRGRVAAPA